MNRARTGACVMILVECVTFALISRSYLVACIAAVAALIALPDHRRISLTRNQALAALGVAGILVAIPHLLGLYTLFGPRGTVFGTFGIMWFFADVCLVVQAALLFFAPEEDSPQLPVPYPRTFVLLGAVAMVGTGVVRATDYQQILYGFLGAAFVVTALVFGAAATETARPPTRRLGGYILQVAVLTVALLAGAAASSLIAAYGNEIDQYLAGALSDRNSPQTVGFSRRSRLDSISEMRGMNQAIVLRVYNDTAPGYLRACVYDTYNNGRWFPSPLRDEVNPAPAALEGISRDPTRDLYQVRAPSDGPLDLMEIWQDDSLRDATFLPLDTELVQARAGGMSVDEHNAVIPDRLDTSLPVTTYVASGHAPRPPSVEQLQRLLNVPQSLDHRVRELASDLLGPLPDAAKKVAAVQEHFRNNYQYRLGMDIPPGNDPLSYFVLERPPAHCEFFASGAVVLLRLGGVPARYVTGFLVAERNPYGSYWIARNCDAHAWAEAYVENEGWVIVEATPADGVPSPDSGAWLAGIGDASGQWWHKFRQRVAAFGIRHVVAAGIVRANKWLFTPVGIATLVMVTVLVSIWAFKKARLYLRNREPITPELRALHRLLMRHDKALRRKGLRRGQSETLHAFAARIEHESPNLTKQADWYRRCAEARYGGSPITEKTLADLKVLPR
jgi:transglutaminase-like putative cysteine protease